MFYNVKSLNFLSSILFYWLHVQRFPAQEPLPWQCIPPWTCFPDMNMLSVNHWLNCTCVKRLQKLWKLFYLPWIPLASTHGWSCPWQASPSLENKNDLENYRSIQCNAVETFHYSPVLEAAMRMNGILLRFIERT